MARLQLHAGAWYYRAKLPADLRKRLNRAELTYSLRTADECIAPLRRAAREVV